jgi:sterol desaturase/sphingolipid hydroxylase (fatty acid hydroxylase superfamily)
MSVTPVPYPPQPPRGRRSWLAHIAAGLGLLSLAGVLCFHFPELLTSRDFRAVYDETFARRLLLAGLIAAFGLGTLAILRGKNRGVALTGVISAGLAVLLGGATVHFDPIAQTPYSLGLDWFILSLFVSALIFIPIEHALAVKPMSPLRWEWRTDLAYFFLSHMLVQFILIAATASTSVVASFVTIPGVTRLVRSLPVLIQFILAVFVADLAQALLHRAYHNLPFLWRFHAVHHSSRHLDWLAGSRTHLVEVILTRSAVLAPLVLIGFSQAALNGYVILVGVQAVVAHANLRLNFGWLEYVIVTPRYHHWHHARDAAYADANYAIHLPLVDMLMGTFKRPPAKIWPEEYGVFKLESVPRGFWPQQVMPFSPRQTFEDYVGRPRHGGSGSERAQGPGVRAVRSQAVAPQADDARRQGSRQEERQ